jgi:hypothetical protein
MEECGHRGLASPITNSFELNEGVLYTKGELRSGLDLSA